jgi:hypothetical protein
LTGFTRSLPAFAVAVVLFSLPSVAGAQTGDVLLDRLESVPGLTVEQERTAPAPYRYFVLAYLQPVDHGRPERGTFRQRFTLLHRGFERPTVLYTSGYNVSTPTNPSRSEPTRLVDGNQISVEQRFFGQSRPEPADWSTLDIWQAASDHHRLITALKPIYTTRWLSTGGSKGGMTSIYHRRFYPDDVDGTVAYVAPNDVVNAEDAAYEDFFETVGTPECRATLTALEREALGPRRDALVARYAAAAQANGWTFNTLGSVERAFEIVALDTAWAFWQYSGLAQCPSVPAATASTAELYEFIDETVSFGFYSDQGLAPYVPYYFQASTELGWPEPRFNRLHGLLRYRGLYQASSAVPAALQKRFEPQRMRDIDTWVKQRGSELLFIYGENDPWSAERFVLGPWTRDSYAYQAAGANHGANISRLRPGDGAAATAAVQRWAGLPAAGSPTLDSPRNAALDARDEALERRP